MKSGELVKVRLLEEDENTDHPSGIFGKVLVHVTASGKNTVEFWDEGGPLVLSQQEDLRPYATTTTTTRYCDQGERVGVFDQEHNRYVGGTIPKKHSSYNDKIRMIIRMMVMMMTQTVTAIGTGAASESFLKGGKLCILRTFAHFIFLGGGDVSAKK
jgi:hypothetical protein